MLAQASHDLNLAFGHPQRTPYLECIPLYLASLTTQIQQI